MVPPAPARFSTISGWPRASPSRVPTSRAVMSARPAGALGTIRRIGRDGQAVPGVVCAEAVATQRAALQAAAICNERADVRRHGATRERAARWLPGAVHGFDTVLVLRMAGPF